MIPKQVVPGPHWVKKLVWKTSLFPTPSQSHVAFSHALPACISSLLSHPTMPWAPITCSCPCPLVMVSLWLLPCLPLNFPPLPPRLHSFIFLSPFFPLSDLQCPSWPQHPSSVALSSVSMTVHLKTILHLSLCIALSRCLCRQMFPLNYLFLLETSFLPNGTPLQRPSPESLDLCPVLLTRSNAVVFGDLIAVMSCFWHLSLWLVSLQLIVYCVFTLPTRLWAPRGQGPSVFIISHGT